MASISFSIAANGTIESVTAAANAPAGGAGTVEVRIDQTANAVTDAAYTGSTRPLKLAEALQLIDNIRAAMVRQILAQVFE